ncbi:hypothetical protein M0R45_028126 [Rubus argutus]|uniref:Peptidase A1 domain-containing protein n=1 Tax=Rubus argutus TaxID=59490 RepID=A0AAW1W3Q1_RUBAR
MFAVRYHYEYGDGSVTRGILAKETIALESTSGSVALKNIVFGCGHNNTGVFNQDDMGLIGLGGGPISFISQMAPSLGGKMFSYCLVPFHTDPSVESKMSFGKGSEVLGDGVVTSNFLIGIDLERKVVSFKATDWSKH